MQLPKIHKSFYQLRPARVILDTIRSYGLIALALYGAAISQGTQFFVPMTVLAILVIGTQQYALQIIHHDGMHWRLFEGKVANDLFCRLFLSPYLFSLLESLRFKHLAHHSSLGTLADPDRYYHATKGKQTPLEFLWFLSSLQSIVATLSKVDLFWNWALARDEVPSRKLKPTPRKEKAAQARLFDLFLMVLVQLAIALGLFEVFGWYGYFVFWLLPFFLGVWLPQNIRSFAEHAHPESDSEADSHREITFVSSTLERIFFAPMNMNYHAEHHFYPGVPYYNLPALRAHLEQTGRVMESVQYRRSYLGFIWQYWKSLPITQQSSCDEC